MLDFCPVYNIVCLSISMSVCLSVCLCPAATTGHTSVASAKVKNNSKISRGHEAEGGVAGGRVKVKKDNCTGPWPGYTDCQGKMEVRSVCL